MTFSQTGGISPLLLLLGIAREVLTVWYTREGRSERPIVGAGWGGAEIAGSDWIDSSTVSSLAALGICNASWKYSVSQTSWLGCRWTIEEPQIC